MSHSAKGAPKRQRSWIKALRPGVAPLREFALNSDKPSPPDNKRWAALARRALMLGDEGPDAILKQAFQAFLLDPKNPVDWRVLATLLAFQLFDEPKRSGAPKRWTTERIIKLSELIAQRQIRNQALSVEQAYAAIIKDKQSPEYFRAKTPGALAKAFERGQKSPEVIRELLVRGVIVKRRNAKSRPS